MTMTKVRQCSGLTSARRQSLTPIGTIPPRANIRRNLTLIFALASSGVGVMMYTSGAWSIEGSAALSYLWVGGLSAFLTAIALSVLLAFKLNYKQLDAMPPSALWLLVPPIYLLLYFLYSIHDSDAVNGPGQPAGVPPGYRRSQDR